jgi:pyruvate/2-oxoglutarate dehydrogenase complex dihydrolipoamide dehydrogenase (E3) component
VIGGGAGGLVTAAGSSNMGAHVALIERNFLGGDCLVTGCVPSKAFLKCANVMHTAKHASEYGINIQGSISANFAAIMERMRKIRSDIAENDSAKRFADRLGCDLYFGNAKFTSPNAVEVNGKVLNFNKACIATGGRPFVPKIEGLYGEASVPYYTSENIFNLKVQPKTLAILGGGPIASELGQAFQRLGTSVTFVTNSKMLPREDKDASDLLFSQL